MRTRKESTVVAVRVSKDARKEFEALTKETGTTTARKIREAYEQQLVAMRNEANARRHTNHEESWEEYWSSHADNAQA